MAFLKPQSRFFGFRGMVRNLLHGIRSGESFLISGGPFIGKTALIRYLIHQLEEENLKGNYPAYRPVYFPCRNLRVGHLQEIADQLHYQLDTTYPKGLGLDRFILFMDDCEVISKQGEADILRGLLSPTGVSLLGVPWSVFWSGSEVWFQDYLRTIPKTTRSLRLVPLSILTEKDARGILLEVLGPLRSQEEGRIILTQTGRHPFLLITLLTKLETDPSLTLNKGLEKCRPVWETWAHRCWEQLNLDPEKKVFYRLILQFLIGQKFPINPSEVEKAVDLHEIKPYLDTLCRLGLSDRTLRDGEATVQAGCHFFNDWYKRIVNDNEEC